MSEDFTILLERIQALTGLGQREAAKIAFEFEDDEVPSAPEIIEKAQDLGYDVEAKSERESGPSMDEPMPEVSFDPAFVLSEVYAVEPRVLCQEFPRLGRASNEAAALIEQMDLDLPDDVKALLVKIDLMEGKFTVWLRDEANEVDRPIGPIDLTRYDSEHALSQGIMTLVKRLPLILRADHN